MGVTEHHASRLRLRLRPETTLRVTYDDRTPFGSPLGDRAEANVRDLYRPLLDAEDEAGTAAMVQASAALLGSVVRSAPFREIARPRGWNGGDPDGWELCPSVLHPDPDLCPACSLVVAGPSGAVSIDVPPGGWPVVHRLTAALAGPGIDPADPAFADVRNVLEGLAAHDLVARIPAPPVVDGDVDLLFVGHNTVVVRGDETSALVDPFLFGADRRRDGLGYQPLGPAQLGRIDVIAITHSHPDHFDPGTLLQFPASTTIVVPSGRETLLGVDLVHRVRELGFTDVVELPWWASHRVGDIEITAMPFLGEQPTDGHQLHPEIRNHGNTYSIATPRRRLAFLADTGRDGRGDMRDVALQARHRLGPADLVFGGYRGWSCYPVQLLHSSVARYLLFVPPDRWATRVELMSDIDAAIDTAERWGATALVPYADGGAPWYWDIGLGPRLDERRAENPGFDPFPERVLDALGRRAQRRGVALASPVAGLLLRPGDGLAIGNRDGGDGVVRMLGHAWPYDTPGPGRLAHQPAPCLRDRR